MDRRRTLERGDREVSQVEEGEAALIVIFAVALLIAALGHGLR